MNNLQHEGKGDSVEGKRRGGGQKGLKKKKGCPPPPSPFAPLKFLVIYLSEEIINVLNSLRCGSAKK